MSDYEDGVDQTEGDSGFLSHLPIILWQRRWLVAVPLVACSIAGIASAFLLPATYRSSATLLVESQELPADLVGSPTTNLIDKRIAKIRQQILSRSDLVQLIQTNNLYGSERQTKPLSTLVDRMRSATSISPVNADVGGQGSNTIAFSLSFEYPDALKAQLVAQDFVDRLLSLDTTQTADQAASTVTFLQDQADSLASQVAAIEQQIQQIKAANGMTLSSAGMMMMPSGGGGYESQIAGLQRENSQLTEQLNVLGSDRNPAVAAAEAQLANMRSIYSDNHPDVKLAEQRLAEVKRFAANNASTRGTSDMIRSQIASNNAMIATLNSARATDQARASSMVAAQSRAPVLTEQITQLQAKADGLRQNYQRVATSLMNARTSAKMGAEQKGERLTVVDAPVVADRPSWPNRPLLIAGGIVAGAGIGLALALALELFMRPVRGVGAIQRLTGSPPLVVVPTLRREKVKRRWMPRIVWPFRRKASA